jgi:hypothetical protein
LRRAGRRGPARRALLLAGGAAAALVILAGAGVGTGFVHVTLDGPGFGTGTALTAVTGCSQLEQAHGTLKRVNGSSLVIQTAAARP